MPDPGPRRHPAAAERPDGQPDGLVRSFELSGNDDGRHLGLPELPALGGIIPKPPSPAWPSRRRFSHVLHQPVRRRPGFPLGMAWSQERSLGPLIRSEWSSSGTPPSRPGTPDLTVALHATDDSAHRQFTYYLGNSSGTVARPRRRRIPSTASPAGRLPAAGEAVPFKYRYQLLRLVQVEEPRKAAGHKNP